MSSRRRRIVTVVVAVGALAAAAVGTGVAVARSNAGPTPSRAASDRPCPRPYVEVQAVPPPRKTDAHLRRVAHVDEPSTAIFRPDGSGDGFLASRLGRVWRIEGGEVTRDVVLDLGDDTAQEGDGGLLNLALDPDGRWLYAYHTDRDQTDHITAYPIDAGGAPRQDQAVEILTVDHGPSEQHHGGGFAFGPDGDLYVGLGDGGGLGDPRENAQDPSVILGKILRITPTPDADQPYSIPPDNPYVDRAGWRPEIFALGVRNPFRLGFDTTNGDLWIGDVGQTCWEELDRLPAGTSGQNLGWDVREGTHEFEGGHLTNGTSTEPEQTYAHSKGWCAIVLGPVGPDGVLHTDYCKGRIMRFVAAGPGRAPQLFDTGLRVENPINLVAGPDGPAGDPWVLSLAGDVYDVQLG